MQQGLLGYSMWTKVTAATRQLACGIILDILEENIRMISGTGLQCGAIIEIYGEEYLRTPTRLELDNFLAVNQERSFPGMIGSIDCMHWETWNAEMCITRPNTHRAYTFYTAVWCLCIIFSVQI